MMNETKTKRQTNCDCESFCKSTGIGVACDDHGASSLPNEPLETSKSGIDVQKAFDILSLRASHNHDHSHDNLSSCCEGVNGQQLPEVLRSMGQRIDLFPPSEDSVSANSTRPSSEILEPSKEPQNGSTSLSGSTLQRKNVRDSLHEIPFTGLLKMVLKAQEDRVRTYRLYDEALNRVLISKKLTDYPPACVSATAAFSVLSDTIIAVRDELSLRCGNAIRETQEERISTIQSVIESINKLQFSEREKLQFTAAFHLEKIRMNDVKASQQDEQNIENAESMSREVFLLNEGVDSLRRRIESCRSAINDEVEDIKCVLVDEVDGS